MVEVRPELTAITRSKPSKPFIDMVKFLGDTRGMTFLDYGCGRGKDLTESLELFSVVHGFDPYYLPLVPIRSDVVGLHYVLCVISSKKERENTLKEAFDLAKKFLSVSVRTDKAVGVAYKDGVITKRKTFQKNFTKEEFLDTVNRVCKNCQVHKISDGHVILEKIFKDGIV